MLLLARAEADLPFHRLAYGPRALQNPSMIEWLHSGRSWATVGGRHFLFALSADSSHSI